MRDRVATLISGRRERLAQQLGHALSSPVADAAPLDDAKRAYLLDEALDLYWNELEWEHITEEEATEGAPLSELTFPGVLAFVRGLLLTEVNADALAPAEPRPEVVESFVAFLAGRVLELEESVGNGGATEPDELARARGELTTTDRLLDLVLYLYHGLDEAEVERVEAAANR
jgi:hypothetical protein